MLNSTGKNHHHVTCPTALMTKTWIVLLRPEGGNINTPQGTREKCQVKPVLAKPVMNSSGTFSIGGVLGPGQASCKSCLILAKLCFSSQCSSWSVL
jgi:hypothetical protein